MNATVRIESWSHRRYAQPVEVPCVVVGQVRRYMAACGPHVVPYGVVTVEIDGEERDVSACRVRVEGRPIWDARRGVLR